MRGYLDTEFEQFPASLFDGLKLDFKNGIRLISIGIVADNDDYFYMEIEEGKDGWSRGMCSEFTTETVLPLLEGGNRVGSYAEVSAALKTWLELHAIHKIMSDHVFDWHFFKQLMADNWPVRLAQDAFEIANVYSVVYEREYENTFDPKTNPRHHALHDARALKNAQLASIAAGYVREEMRPSRIYIDTEFEHLPHHTFGNPAHKIGLISIAAVDDVGSYFYREFADGWSRKLCSQFTIDTVLPLLEGSDCVKSYIEVSNELRAWIEERVIDEVMSDSNIDWEFIKKLLYKNWPDNLEKDAFVLADMNLDIFDSEYESYFDPVLNPRHHALTDAKALRHAQLACDNFLE